ncbi:MULTISPECIES: D-ribose pyranase [Sporosarcina]|uniref:D-ribose pyranase n=1 Tax=Sporosarcina psychrophila TaxID=1476 RepID=A0ABV2K3P4_SPOPS|nr:MULTISPECIES: D-ribose pyranase [Sporosarcina]AMQ07639.1 D-ribose pyranase [Sporosarcina psychrophila]QNK87367.1 D-ribose pyranase [Sporosarcina sp. resist]
MKKHGILNRELAAVFAKLGHTDQVTIADCGLPIPDGVHCIDLSYTIGKPSFIEIVGVVLEDLEVEHAFIASEIESRNTEVYEILCTKLPSITKLAHEDLKQLTHKSKVIIRTGEATPFANIVLQSGVIF